MSPEIEEFARLLILYVRDAAIQSNDRALLSSAKHSLAKRWANAAHELPPSDFARVIIPDVVDDTIFFLLQAIDQGDLQLIYRASDGSAVDLTDRGHGELAGWFIGNEGWRDTYSKERFADDSADPLDSPS